MLGRFTQGMAISFVCQVFKINLHIGLVTFRRASTYLDVHVPQKAHIQGKLKKFKAASGNLDRRF